MERWMHLREAAEQTPFEKEALAKACRRTVAVEGEAPPLRASKDLNGRWVVKASDLQAWMEEQLS